MIVAAEGYNRFESVDNITIVVVKSNCHWWFGTFNDNTSNARACHYRKLIDLIYCHIYRYPESTKIIKRLLSLVGILTVALLEHDLLIAGKM